ncbi:kinesin-domain-containing protein [Ramaria rubella]|nr:kinesin-domain-containing protein [Ramaria rubella]
MSFRRPATATGSRKQNMPLPVTAGRRPKSALSKSAASSGDDLHLQDTPTSASPPRQRFKKNISTYGDESNIQVIIRCRRRSDREVQDGSPVIVTTGGPRSEDITIETASPSSTLGVITLPPTRTYAFDRVFGPEADQAMVYSDVVAPILEQVLMGYNCTLFAYGQTGTGKTHTMQGDLIPSHLGNPSANAGMIPRVLFKLFQHLENHVVDFSVKISFVELYNEELRDLLAPEMTTPTGTVQPMSIGSGQQAQSQSNVSLKIFDDTSKRGVIIQGLEEVSVKDTADAIALLTKGSQRRQIAATKFNDHSSRSHSVFSITVHLKETSALGDDLLKVGKLNLVDLAGSENIGRSGAENKRAREAGMINQSLLTLGRVINALVEKSSHVPYRESKLTRLLQDSLGGRTKTCIIATVSPARCNMEETLSTLEYALRAKSIRNKPEVNQRLTKNALIKEYVGEIERLKADLVSAREMNGIYFSQDSWDQLSTENEARQAQYEEAKRQIAIAESHLNAVREEFEQSIALLTKRESELTSTKETLRLTIEQLRSRENELEVVKDELEEEVVVRDAHQKTEGILNTIAEGLKATLENSVEDIHGLFEKLERKSTVAGANALAVSKYGRSLHAEISSVNAHLQEFVSMSNQLSVELQANARQCQETENRGLTVHTHTIEEHLRRLSGFLTVIHTEESSSEDAIKNVQAAVREAGEIMKRSFSAWSLDLKRNCESLCSEVQRSSLRSAGAVEQAFKAMGTVLQSVIREAHEYVETERGAAADFGLLVKESTDMELDYLRQQNMLLTQLLHVERAKSERARDGLIQRISGLLEEYTETRDQSLREAVELVHQNVSARENTVDQFLSEHSRHVEAGIKRRRDWDASLEKRDAHREEVGAAGIETLSTCKNGFDDGLTAVQKSITSSITLQTAELDTQAENTTAACSNAFNELDRVKRARTHAAENLGIEAQDGCVSLQRGLSALSSDLTKSMNTLMDQAANLETSTQVYYNKVASKLSNIQHATRTLLETATMEDTSTGATPHKRNWEYPDQWSLTETRDKVVRQWRDNAHIVLPIRSQRLKREDPEPESFTTEILNSDVSIVEDVKMAEESALVSSSLSDTPSSYSAPVLQPMSQVPRSTGAVVSGKVSKISVFGPPTALKERSTNLFPVGPGRPR